MAATMASFRQDAVYTDEHPVRDISFDSLTTDSTRGRESNRHISVPIPFAWDIAGVRIAQKGARSNDPTLAYHKAQRSWHHYGCMYSAADRALRIYRDGEVLFENLEFDLDQGNFSQGTLHFVSEESADLQDRPEELLVWTRALTPPELKEDTPTSLNIVETESAFITSLPTNGHLWVSNGDEGVFLSDSFNPLLLQPMSEAEVVAVGSWDAAASSFEEGANGTTLTFGSERSDGAAANLVGKSSLDCVKDDTCEHQAQCSDLDYSPSTDDGLSSASDFTDGYPWVDANGDGVRDEYVDIQMDSELYVYEVLVHERNGGMSAVGVALMDPDGGWDTVTSSTEDSYIEAQGVYVLPTCNRHYAARTIRLLLDIRAPGRNCISAVKVRGTAIQQPAQLSLWDEVTYHPDANYHGEDSFSYTLGMCIQRHCSHLLGDWDSVHAVLMVHAVNDPPQLRDTPGAIDTFKSLVAVSFEATDVDVSTTGMTFELLEIISGSGFLYLTESENMTAMTLPANISANLTCLETLGDQNPDFVSGVSRCQSGEKHWTGSVLYAPVRPREEDISEHLAPLLRYQAVDDAGLRSNGSYISLPIICRAGYIPNFNGVECVPCDAGSHWVMNSNQFNGVCIDCPAGSYTAETGASQCVACPENTTTVLSGVQSIHFCECEKNYYHPEQKIGEGCKPCPVGAKCDGKQYAPYAKRAMNLVDGDFNIFFRCRTGLDEDCSKSVNAGYLDQETADELAAKEKFCTNPCFPGNHTHLYRCKLGTE
eukprot:gene17240-20511_t